jgi:hypothetical protein
VVAGENLNAGGRREKKMEVKIRAVIVVAASSFLFANGP